MDVFMHLPHSPTVNRAFGFFTAGAKVNTSMPTVVIIGGGSRDSHARDSQSLWPSCQLTVLHFSLSEQAALHPFASAAEV
jgi:hypothetical protein